MFERDDGEILRVLSPAAAADWHELAATDAYARLVDDGRLISTTAVDRAPEPPGFEREVGAVVRHERIECVSYPFEWPFSMLRDAALLQLDVLDALLDAQFVLKDGSAYNVQWKGSTPVFIDVGSIERARPGEPWSGYRQFCMQFLYPLMLQAYTGATFQPWLRGHLDGIEPAQMRAILGPWRALRRGVLTHVLLHAALERRQQSRRGVRAELRDAGFETEMIRANARRLRRLVERLRWREPRSPWEGYHGAAVYDDASRERKSTFTAEVAGTRSWDVVWDVGCHDGRYARLAAAHARTVVAFDVDQVAVDGLYRALRDERDQRIVPLVHDIADPSPAAGWNLAERRPLIERAPPQLVLALAVVHHLALARNVPLPWIVDWLASLGATVVVEFADRDDAMVRDMLARKPERLHDDYGRERFEGLLSARLDVVRSERLAVGTRTLYLAEPR